MLNPVQLRSFAAVLEAGSFTAAARRLGLRQSTVSQHVAKLEEAVGRMLLLRDTHQVTATADGQALSDLGRDILAAHRRAEAWVASAARRERLRFGVSEDLVLGGLHEVLRRFSAAHPGVDLDLTVGLSRALVEKLDGGALDLVMAKRRESARGRLMWREGTVWLGSRTVRVEAGAPVPLVVYDDRHSVTRALAIETLERAGLAWRLASTSGQLTGLLAALKAGLGVSLQGRCLLAMEPEGVGFVDGLPETPAFDVVVLARSVHPGGAAGALARFIEGNSGLLGHVSGAGPGAPPPAG